jgi:hypothetical protein
MSNPRDTLRTLIEQPFSSNHLRSIERAVTEIDAETAGDRVACFVVHTVCYDVRGFMSGIEPISPAVSDVIEQRIMPPLLAVLDLLASNNPVQVDSLAKLIDESRAIRTTLRSANLGA